MAETFLSPVIEKLVDLLVDEAKSLKGVHKEVKSLQKELEIIEPFLRDAEAKSDRGELSDASKVWLRQLREEAERIEDVVDEYLYHLHQGRHQGGFVRALRKAGRCVKALSSRQVIASEIRDVKASVSEIRERGLSFGLRPFEQAGSRSNAADPRIGSLFIDDDELVGIESKVNQLVKSSVEGPAARSVISVVGEGGIGKTTLAKKVYNEIVTKGHFDSHVWITVSQSYNIEKILKMMKNQVCPEEQLPGGDIVTIEELVGLLRNSFQTKRYVVVFDDVWKIDFWDVIKHALPDNHKGSRIILTTRNSSVVESFQETSCDVVQGLKSWKIEQAWELFCKKAFYYEFERLCPTELEQLSYEILTKCQGLPLAIVAVAGLLSKKEKTQIEWRKVLDNLSHGFKGDSKLSHVNKVLLLSYHDLPYHLKLCFCYFGIFPEDYSLIENTLYTLWIAEGFIKPRKDEISLEQIAKEYLTELINRNLILCEVQFGNDKMCKVHDLFHEIILSKIDELCFCQIFKENKLMFKGRSRRLFIQGNANDALNIVSDSKICSVFSFDVNELSNCVLVRMLRRFKLLKILNFGNAPLDNLPKEVGSLFHLRYLDLCGTNIKKLPKSIGRLHNLQFLDIGNTLVRELPIEINKLRNLRHIYAASFDKGIELSLSSYCGVRVHEGIGRLEELQTLIHVEAYPSGVSVVKELHKLRKLKCLGMSKVTSEMGKSLGNSIQEMKHLEELFLIAMNEDEILDLNFNPSPPIHLRYLQLGCRLLQLPTWISELHNLQGLELSFSRMIHEPLKCLKCFPNLAFLRLYCAYDGEELHFEEGGFQKLKHLELRKLHGLKVLKIDKGAMPLLEKLDFGPFPMMKEMPSDIQHLLNLKYLYIGDMPKEFVIALQPNGGIDHWKIQHIPSVKFCYYEGQGVGYKAYKLGSPHLFRLLEAQTNRSTPMYFSKPEFRCSL